MTHETPTYLPIISRYILREFFRLFGLLMGGFITIYLIVDFFDRLDILMEANASGGAALRYFLFKIPLIVTQTLPAAVMAAILLSLGMLGRSNEIVALRASGVSLGQMAVPLLTVAALISLGALIWGETVVPYTTQTYQEVNRIEIRKRGQRAILSDRAIWFHGAEGFYHIDYVDKHQQALHGVRIFRTTPTFTLHSIIEIPQLTWTGDTWHSTGTREYRVAPDGNITLQETSTARIALRETFADFLAVHRDPEELSFLALRQRLVDLAAKGIDASSDHVDLYLKLAVPFAPFILAFVAIPLAGRVQRHQGIASALGKGLVVGFGYWVILALARSLGQSGALSPVFAAWVANMVFLSTGVGLYLRPE